MDKVFNINKKAKRSLPTLSSEISGINNIKKKEDSRRSSDKLSSSDNFSIINSSKGIKHYNFNKTKNFFLPEIDYSEKKRKENLKNKLITKTKYLSIFNSSKKPNSLKKSNFFMENKLKNLFKLKNSPKKDQQNKYNISILQKFNKDFKKYFVNSIENSKNEFQKNVEKINKTFYKSSHPKNIEIKKDVVTNQNSIISDQSQKSFSSFNKSKENNLENKILKTKYSSQLIKFDKNYKRKRNFRKYIDEKKFLDKEWNKKIGITKSNIYYNNLLLNDLIFQSRTIKDELCLLSDDIQYYRLSFLGNDDLFSSFKNLPIKKQVKINQILEETCALLHYVPKIILKEYYYSTDKFIAIEDPSKEMFSKKIVYNELETFQENLKYLYKISNFVKCCGEVYLQLISQVEGEMAITSQNFLILREVLERIRFYIIDLTNFSKNILMNYCFDKYVIINKFKRVIKQSKIDTKRINTEEKIKKTKYRKYRLKLKPKLPKNSTVIANKDQTREALKSKVNNKNITEKEKINDEDDDIEKMNDIRKSFDKNKNFVNDKMLRIKKALDLNNIYDKANIKNLNEKIINKKKDIKPMDCINSILMAKMLKYIKKDIREKIISLRTCERHLNYDIEEN